MGVPMDVEKIHISLCMIVRNEEAVLGRCLDSVKGLADEIIVVDTGSCDKTIDIARGLGAKVYEHPWENDFGRHRNQAIGYAGGEWILVMDADEVIARRDIERIRGLLSSPTVDGYRFILRNYEDNKALANLVINPCDYEEGLGFYGFIPVSLIRLFRNCRGISFSGMVHETVDESFRAMALRVIDSQIPIHHYGKVMNERLAGKAEFYIRLGQEKIRREPDNLSAYKGLADQYLESGEPVKALDILGEGIARFPDLVELRFDRGVALDRMNCCEDAKSDYQWVLEKMPDHSGACHNLARICLDEENAGQAIRLLNRGIKHGIRHPSLFFVLGRALCALERWREAISAFDRVLEMVPGYNEANYFRALALSNIRRYDAAMESLRCEIDSGGNLTAAYNLLGKIYLSLGDSQRAADLFRRVLSIRADDPTALDSLERMGLSQRSAPGFP